MAVEISTRSARLGRSDGSLESILSLALGFMASKHLFAASEIGLFAGLASGPSTLDELSARVGVPRRTLRILADALVALGLLNCDGARYENTESAQTYLSGQTANDLRPLLAAWNRVSYPAWQDLVTKVRSSGPDLLAAQLSRDEMMICTAAAEALSAGPARTLVRAFDFSR